MRIGLIGDIHGQLTNIRAIFDWIEEIQPDWCLNTGEYGCYEINWPVPVFWVMGNHEDSMAMRQYINGEYPERLNNHWLMGGIVDIEGVSVMALPGLLNPRQEPGPARYPENVYKLCESQSDMPVDIFISHGCGFSFWVFAYDRKLKKQTRINREEPDITELIKKVKPKYAAVSGHNHRYAVDTQDGIELVRLGYKKTDMFHIIEL